MFSFFSQLRVVLLLCAMLALHGSIVAQDRSVSERAQALKAAIAEQKAALLAADSSKDAGRSVQVRLALATLLKPKEAQVLLSEASALADSAGLQAEELSARKALVQSLADQGSMKRAYEEAMALSAVVERFGAVQVDASNARSEDLRLLALAQRDSSEALAKAARRDAEERIADANDHAEFWMMVAIGSIILGVITVLVLLFTLRRELGRQREQVRALQVDLRAYTERQQIKLREPLVAPPTVKVEEPRSPVITAPPAQAVEIDPMVDAMFRKQGPERLAALREARARNDHDKVRRVVHTFKPQLAGLAPELVVVASRIMASESAVTTEAWNADLDTFEKGVSALLS